MLGSLPEVCRRARAERPIRLGACTNCGLLGCRREWRSPTTPALWKTRPRVFLPVTVLAYAVSIFAPGAEPEQIAAAVEGCNQALGEERCAASAEGDAGDWQATITWSDAERRFAHVRLVRLGVEESVLVTRDVEFGADDPLEQRFRAVGLIVAAYVVATGRSDAAAAPPPAPQLPDELPHRAEDDVTRRVEVHSAGWGVDGAALIGTTFEGRSLSQGVALKPWWRPLNLPLFLLGQMRWRTSNDVLRADWLSGSLGAGVRVAPAAWPLGLELRVEGVTEYVALRAEETSTGRTDRADLWRFGARGGADVVVSFAEDWGLFVGGDANVFRPKLLVDVAGQPAGREPALLLQGLVGLRFQGD